MAHRIYPSIWLADFDSKSAFDARWAELDGAMGVLGAIDDRFLLSQRPFSIRAYCVICEDVTEMMFDWKGCYPAPTLAMNWAETFSCSRCHMIGRVRGLLDFVKTRLDLSKIRRAYVAEEVSPVCGVLGRIVPEVVGSEYLGPHHKGGDMLPWKDGRVVRHEDLTALSFKDGEFDLAITMDVFEHVPDYRKSFAEIRRILGPSGVLVFSIPFQWRAEQTVVRASRDAKGEVIHHLPPVMHGNPLSDDGSLCFHDFGWDILQTLRDAGFGDARACAYWGPWKAHMGFPQCVFAAYV